MTTLREGDSGPNVTALQNQLKDRGFPPGAIDGDFGPATEAAVLAFQKSEGIPPDGIVGAQTSAALSTASTMAVMPSPGMLDVTIAIVSKMFPATHLDNINANLPAVLDALEANSLTSVPLMLAALATIRAETEDFTPISERISRYNTSPHGHPFDLYDYRKDLGNHGIGDGARFKGRGYVQLTGRANYARFGPEVGVDLVTEPDLANDKVTAAQLLAIFIKSKEASISHAMAANDYAEARRLVNGGTNGLDRFIDAYNIGMRLLTS